MNEENQEDKPIRSFAIRSGRMTDGQRNAFDLHWQIYGMGDKDAYLETKELEPFDQNAAFNRQATLVFEIGFGMGDSLHDMCVAEQDVDFIGVEVHRPGLGRLMTLAAESNLSNLKLYIADARNVLDYAIADNSLDRVQLYFPDPWQKKKHQKRRIVKPEFVALVNKKLKPGGLFHMATDWEHYAQNMLKVMQLDSVTNLMINISKSGNYCEKPPWRPETKFERRGQKLGHGVWDLIFEKK